MYDLAIIGGGPAGTAAGIYASRKKLNTILITKEWGGQSTVSPDIQNWIGTPSISGNDLAAALKKHLETYQGDTVSVHDGACATTLEKSGDTFKVTTEDGKNFEAKAVLIASGAHRRKLEVPGAAEFDQKGLTYCASCDGPMFTDQDVVVIGGGNAAFESAAQLLAYTKSVTLLNRSNVFKADPITVEKVLANEKMTVMKKTEPTEVVGEQMVSGLKYKNTETGEAGELKVTGIFVEIGMLPNTDFAGGVIELDDFKRIVVDPKNQKTSAEGIWAAGDCTNELYHQNNIAAGDAIKALEDIYAYLHAR